MRRLSVREQRPGCPANVHDSYSAYGSYGCRCPVAREEWRLYRKRLRHNRQPPLLVPGWRVARRIQALACIGWSLRELGRRFGGPHAQLSLMGTKRLIRLSSFERVDALYRELSMTPGPSATSRRIARQKGWAPPLAWDDIDDPNERPAVAAHVDIVPHDRLDEIVVDRAVASGRPRMSSAEKDAAVDRLDAKGLSAADIAARLGIAQRSVVRIRTRIRDAGSDLMEAS